MNKHTRAVLLAVFLALLLATNRLLSGTFALPTGDKAIWFNAGLFMLVVGSYWIEYYFTKPADVVINGVVVFISVSTLISPPFNTWWKALADGSLILACAAFILVWSGNTKDSPSEIPLWRRLLYQLVVRLGSSTVLFSSVFILALLSYFNLQSPEIRWAVVLWGIILIARYLDLDGLFEMLWKWRKRKLPVRVGEVSRLSEPNIVRFIMIPDATCAVNTLVAFTRDGVVAEDSPLGLVVTHRTTPDSLEAEAIMLGVGFAAGSPMREKIVVRVSEDDIVISARLPQAMRQQLKRLVGYVFRGSDISRLYFELVGDPPLEEGTLVSVSIDGGRDLFFQLINGKLHEEASLENGERCFTVAEAEQLGTWSGSRQGFETHSWVVPENAAVFQVAEESETSPAANVTGLLDVGRVPRSAFPVKVSVRDLVLYHSAILGVTGSGKSFLAYQLIEACANSDVKVLCLDLTGDYKRFLPDAVLLRSTGDLKPFLDSDYRIGIIEFTEERIHPIAATNTVAQVALAWCRDHRKPEEVKEPVPKVLLVCEEAHSLIPEWNSNPERNLQDTVSKTAQIVLQARKYGLGFMIITQRTANVTKSVLNQCNTIFAFQAYDETGFEFMRNYMGLHYVDALPNLKKRQGVIVGKASISDRPVIVRFHDQERNPATNAIPDFKKTETKGAAKTEAVMVAPTGSA